MERKDFIHTVFSFFNVKDEDQTKFRAYDLALSSGENIDWGKLYMKVIKEAPTRYLPMPQYFIQFFNECKKISVSSSRHDGDLILVILNNGQMRVYASNGLGPSINRIKEQVREVRRYPKQIKIDNGFIDVALIGDSIFPSETPYEVIYKRG